MTTSDRTRPGTVVALRGIALGALGGITALALELARVLWVARGSVASVWEVQHGTFGLGPAWILLGAVGGALGGLVALALERELRVAATVGLALGAGLVGYGVGGGRHLATLALRLGFAGFVALVTALAVFVVFPGLARIARARRTPFALGLLILLGLVALANARVLPRLYPAFHLGLGVVELTLAGLVANLLIVPPRRVDWVAAAFLVVAGAGLVPASRAARGFDNYRWIVQEGSPLLAVGVDVASRVAPPPPLDPALLAEPLGARRARGGGFDLRGRDVLLITVDALRADHVGAYGSRRGATPSIDRLAREGVLFEAAYAATPHTSYSLTSLMTGKYMRPLLVQGAGGDSELWPELLQTYGYRTAAFYPPAVFFIDGERFAPFRDRKFGFEYAKIEFAEGDLRVSQVERYVSEAPRDRRLFLWVHLFGPHEPYEEQKKSFGSRDVDRYDSEVHGADDTIGRLVELVRKRDPKSAVFVSADHGEEFGDHGGRYHGTSVYDEQVRVPLVVSVPGLAGNRRVREPVQTIDLLPTVLGGLAVPIPPRIRGRDLGGLLAGTAEPSPGFAAAETEEYALVAEGSWRLVCARRSNACQLYDVATDPAQLRDRSRDAREVLERLRQKEHVFAASHGEYETQGLRAEGKGWPAALLRGLSGDRSAAPEIARLLDDADVAIRRKSAELLFELADPEQVGALRLAATREEDPAARRWLSLGLTRLGQGAPLVHEILKGPDERERRLAALALAEHGDDAGEDELVRWWASDKSLDFEQAREILAAFAELRSEAAVPGLIARLSDVRLRPYVAETLARIGDEDARPFLLRALNEERYVSARLPLARAILALDGDEELALPLARFLGVPDPLEGGIALALEAGLVEELGGPSTEGLRQLRQLGDSGVSVDVTIPPIAKTQRVRIVARARARTTEPGEIRIERGVPRISKKSEGTTFRNVPDISDAEQVRFRLPGRSGAEDGWIQLSAVVPASWGFRAGHRVALEVFVDRHSELQAILVLPEREELPPPPPEPWEKGD